MGIWYRGSDAEDPLALRTDGNGNEQHGPGIYFFDRADYAKHYGAVSAYRINTRDHNFYTEKPVAIDYYSKAKYWIKNAPDYLDTLQNWGENPDQALMEAARGIAESVTDKVDFALSVWADFYIDHPKEFIEFAKRKGPDGLIIKRHDCNVLVLYRVELARKIKGWEYDPAEWEKD